MGQVFGKVCSDTNANGICDPGEPGIPNVPIRISKADRATVVFGEYMTDSNGEFSSGRSIWDYPYGSSPVNVKVEVVTPPVGSSATGDSDGLPFGEVTLEIASFDSCFNTSKRPLPPECIGNANFSYGIDASTPPQDTIAEIVEDSEVHNTLDFALKATGLFGFLDSGASIASEGEYTLFAPTDVAFGSLPGGTIDFLLENPLELADVLRYHMAAGKYLSTDLTDGQKIETLLDNGNLTVTVDGTIMINQATVTSPDTLATNGVVHVIDDVLVPPSLAEMLAGVLP